MEYALYQRELDVAEALVEIEEDRRAEVHGANNVRQEQYNEREKEIQVMSLKTFGVGVGTNTTFL